jgi:hypothetical protein
VYVARQRLGKNITAAMNTRATIEELLDSAFSVRFKGKSVGLSVYSLSLLGNCFVNTFSMRSVSFQKKVCNLLFPELLVSKSVVIFPGTTCGACSGFISIFYMFFSIFPYGLYVL